MERTQRIGRLPALVLLLSWLGSSLALGESPTGAHRPAQSATVILAVDLRELTSLRDIPEVGDVFFRRSERSQNRADGDYDLAIEGSVASDWKSALGGADANRAPHAYQVEPGTYIIEKINIGGGPTTIGPGIDARTHSPLFGSFVVREGEVLNLGRLVVHMHWHEGYFEATVEDNAAQARAILVDGNPGLAAKMQTRMLRVTPRFPFRAGGGRL